MKLSALRFNLSVWILFVAPLHPFAHGHTDNIFDNGDHEHHRGCGFTAPSKKELDKMQVDVNSRKRQRSGIACKGCITIDTYIYAFQSPSTGGGMFVDDAVLKQQIGVLNKGFSETPFKFELKEANIETDDYYYFNFFTPAESASEDNPSPSGLVKKWPRRGGYSSLNIYYAGALDESLVGFAYLPVIGELSTIPFDGVFLSVESLPGGSCPPGTCGRPGGVTIHEVGHWLGLTHVFHSVTGIPCDPNDPNDYVDDTPQMKDIRRGSGFRCPSDSTDTCPRLPGRDPIHNFMDYSTFDCQTEFTPGQIERMFYVWSLYRKDSERCSTGYKLFVFEILTDQFPLDTTWNLASTDGNFYWDMDYQQNGIYFGYFRNTFDSQEICIDASKDYVFTIYDNPPDGFPPDGIFAPGYYAISYDGNQLKRNSDFGQSEATSFSGGGTGPPQPLPPSNVGRGSCFSASSLVTVQSGRATHQVSMRSLRIGDLVQTGVNKFEPVYSFGHRAEDQVAQFLQISTSQGDRLELTPDHMVHVAAAGGFVAAHRVRKGDILQNGNGQDLAVVTKIRTIKSIGIFAPFTPSGELVVNNIRASAYIAFNEGHDRLDVGQISIPCQWLAHAYQFPHRVACHYLGSCHNETYTINGISSWVTGPLRLGQWVLRYQRNEIGGSIIVVMAVALLAIFSVVETIFFNNQLEFCVSALFLGGAIATLIKRRRMTTKKEGCGALPS